ncbi:MAG: CopG family antitoxin [Thermomicrobiales bacterium]
MGAIGKKSLAEIYADMSEENFEEELREFWDTHDSADYFYEGEDVTNNPPPHLKEGPGREGSTALKRPAGAKMELISLRLPPEMIESVKRVAAQRHLPYQSLMRSWIGERLADEERADQRKAG